MAPVIMRPKVVVWSKVVVWAKVIVWSKALRASRSPPTRSEVIVAASPVPVIPPARVPEVAWTPGREGAGLGLNLDCGSQTSQT
jgi:hypothetical protein